MPATLADLTRCEKRVGQILNAGPDDGSYAVPTTDQAKYAPADIVDAIKQIDIEVVRTIQETVGQGYRGQYGAMAASNAYGAALPAHPGKFGSVEIQLTSGSAWEIGILAENVDIVRKLHRNPDNMYGSATENEGVYYISEDLRIYYIGLDARVFIPTEVVIGSTLLAPISYEATLIRGSIKFLLKDPVDGNLAVYGADYARDIDLIRSGAGAVPALDTDTKMGG
jgi:hypothetical protein